MIARHWTGVAHPAYAAAYLEHLQSATFPAIRRLPGFVSASILRRTVPDGVEFLIATTWQSLDAIRAFAGDDTEAAVVPDNVQRMMIRYDHRVRHFDIVA
jgi:heme-degrading monooxygenase HmoA